MLGSLKNRRDPSVRYLLLLRNDCSSFAIFLIQLPATAQFRHVRAAILILSVEECCFADIHLSTDFRHWLPLIVDKNAASGRMVFIAVT